MIAATLLALLILPLIVLRGRTLLASFAADAATVLFAWLLWRRMPGLDPHLAMVSLAVVKLATFSLFLAVGDEVRWSVNRAALVALVVYSVTVPSMLRTPVDGDEPFYLLVTESLASDADLDLRNQYAGRAAGQWDRKDIAGPQFDDPVGQAGEQYSRHEPFLSVLLLPGYLLAGLPGAIATIVLFGALLVRSTLRWMEDEGIPALTMRAVFPLFAFAPPVLFYATRIWPEVPAAFFFVEALRGARGHRAKRWLPALLGLVLLKLRFVLVAAGVVAGIAIQHGRSHRGQRPLRALAIAAGVLLVPLALIGVLTGDATSVHTWRELLPAAPAAYAVGFMGLLLDGMSGIAFQAPFYLLTLFALTRWKATPAGFRTGVLASLLYLFYLVPRGEWFGGWAPPLRYVVFLMPVLALGIASVWTRIPRSAIALVSLWTVGVVIHGVAYPWRLFHEATGENAVGEWLSRLHQSDFSRLFPSFIRINDAAWWSLALLGLATLLAWVWSAREERGGSAAAGRASLLLIAVISLGIAAGFRLGLRPASPVNFEDTHVTHAGGRLYPDVYTVMRTGYRGGRVLESGDSLSFLAREGTHTLHFITGLGATIEVEGQAYTVGPGERYQAMRVRIPRSERVTLRCLSGAINLDRMDRMSDQPRSHGQDE